MYVLINGHVHTIPVHAGLEVLVGDRSYRFDYGWGGFNGSSPRQFKRERLTLHESTYPHFRLHRLTREESLKFFMSMTASAPATLAVVLVNLDDTYRLSERFLSDEGETPPVPVVLVTNETGSQLVRLLEESPRDVEAVIHAENQEQPRTNNATPPIPPTQPSPCESSKNFFCQIFSGGVQKNFYPFPLKFFLQL